jgi:hypothetical protein
MTRKIAFAAVAALVAAGQTQAHNIAIVRHPAVIRTAPARPARPFVARPAPYRPAFTGADPATRRGWWATHPYLYGGRPWYWWSGGWHPYAYQPACPLVQPIPFLPPVPAC